MTKEIRLNAFDMNCVGHIQQGMWTHPRDRSTEYNTIRYWQDLARLAERGKFDGIFLADIVGVTTSTAAARRRRWSTLCKYRLTTP
jgi:long-chain alkane monooxygenase